jgi:hypothetical protein
MKAKLELIKEIESCKYQCEYGPLENNTAWIALKSEIEKTCQDCGDRTEPVKMHDGRLMCEECFDALCYSWEH